jgi:endonuclease-3
VTRSAVARVLRILSGRYPLTMLGGWKADGESPYRHLIGTILSARTRDETTDRVTEALFRRWPDPRALGRADLRAVERLLRPIGFYRMKARYVTSAARHVEAHGVPRTREGLMEIDGVGRKVANCVLVYALGKEAIPVDTHVHRISNRLGWARTRTPGETERVLERIVPRRHWPIRNVAFVAHGKAVCRPVGPRCGACPVERWCKKRGLRTRARRPR